MFQSNRYVADFMSMVSPAVISISAAAGIAKAKIALDRP